MLDYIIKQIISISSPMASIIFNFADDANYNARTKRFEIPISKIKAKHSSEITLVNDSHGNINGTSVHWKICDNNFTFWSE